MSYDLGEYWEERANFYSEPMGEGLTCSCCRKKFPVVNNGDDVSPCCNAQAIETMTVEERYELEHPEDV